MQKDTPYLELDGMDQYYCIPVCDSSDSEDHVPAMSESRVPAEVDRHCKAEAAESSLETVQGEGQSITSCL